MSYANVKRQRTGKRKICAREIKPGEFFVETQADTSQLNMVLRHEINVTYYARVATPQLHQVIEESCESGNYVHPVRVNINWDYE